MKLEKSSRDACKAFIDAASSALGAPIRLSIITLYAASCALALKKLAWRMSTMMHFD